MVPVSEEDQNNTCTYTHLQYHGKLRSSDDLSMTAIMPVCKFLECRGV